ncbi:MAG: phosphomethylpyrimidine synthase ThiC [Candidatus Saganbacteria bacterium]|nr:phosphomethylpyrimidine synthase ThiC [Candidatus Saganbacteria bacterium]
MNKSYIKKISQDENLPVKQIEQGLKNGTIVILKSPLHKNCKPAGVGKGLLTKVNANIGTSQDYPSLASELKKLEVCIKYKADAVMDLSTGGNIDRIRKKILENCPVPLGTVPVYQAVIEAGGIEKLTAETMLDVIERQAADGVDFMTIHSGVTKRSVAEIKKKKRLMGIVSRGGALLYAWMEKHKKENPLFEQYDRVLDICRRYGVVISLGDGLRPGSIFDAGDAGQIEELKILGKLAERARKAGVQVIIEGPGHVPINQIIDQMKLEKKICAGAPFYVLGPLPTDIAAGYDHVACAIGGALAASAGADFLCYVTPAEHLGLPTADDVREGIIVSRIAAHIGDISKGIKSALKRDYEMSKARKALDWQKQLSLALDSEKARSYHKRLSSKRKDVCTMCGDYCAMKVSR